MVNVRNIFFYLMPCTMMLSCTAVDDVSDVAHSELEPNLILSIGKAKTMTRQGLDVIQDEGQEFRGLQSLTVIPFTTNGNAVTVDDTPQILGTTGSETERVTNKNYYYWDQCKMMRGTDRVLAWGKSNPVVGKESAVQNGQLTTTLNGRMYLKDITFSLKSIRETNDVVEQDAKDLANYMTAIANTTGWSTTDDEQLKSLYLNFIHADAQGSGLMAGSAAHVKAYVTELRKQLQTIGGDLSNAIIAIIDKETLKSCLNNGYPSASRSLGLPDGAAALRWTNGAFSVRTEATTLDNINSLTRYTYPAELWYFVDSPIRTSDQNVAKSTYQGRSWDDLITNNYKDGTRIGGNTQSVLVEQPLQYGVARLQMTLKRITASPLKDAKDAEVHYQAVNLPLTAVIIGAQHTVGFDFKPIGEQSDLDARFIYDPIVGTPASNGDHTVNTLVLQTYDGEKVPVVLEFENLTDEKFTGKDGVVYPNTKFYLIGMLDATNEGSGVYWNRVFTQDHTTQVTFEVTSLANAYTCMPDLLSPRLELGVQVQTKWVQSSTTTVVLD